MTEPSPFVEYVIAPDEQHVVAELGLDVGATGDVVWGRAEVTSELCAPGTDELRISVLATWADVIIGAASGRAIEPRIPLTLDLEVQIVRPALLGSRLTAEARVVRAGRTVVVGECAFRDDADGGIVAVSISSFVPAPDPTHVFPDGFPMPVGMGERRLAQPLADRIGCRVTEPGTTEMARIPAGLNAIGAIQGGLLAVMTEDATASTKPSPAPLETMNIRYLRPVMVGPARAVATRVGEVATVRVTDTATDKLCAFASTRIARPRR